MDKHNTSKHTSLDKVKALSKETKLGLLPCYHALKRFDDNYQKALDYLQSDEFKLYSRRKRNG